MKIMTIITKRPPVYDVLVVWAVSTAMHAGLERSVESL